MDRNFARLLDTLGVLHRKLSLSTPDIQRRLLARGHEVTARTVQRDLEQLAAVYPIECDQRSRPFTWRWRSQGPTLSVPAMGWPEALSFHLLASHLEGVMPVSVIQAIEPYVAQARRRLADEFDSLPLAQWHKRVRVVPASQPFVAPKVSRAVQETVNEAILLGRKLRVRYRRFGVAGGQTYAVSPLGLVQHGATFYVPARYDGHQDIRTLTLHRMERAELTEEPSGIEDFDLDAWLEAGAMGFGGHETIRLELRLREGSAGLLSEAPLSEDQVILSEADGVARVTATVRETAQLRRWILGLGSRATVLKPRKLRGQLASEIEAALAGYRSSSRSTA